MKQGQASASKS
jgi:hypothetical protein